MNQVIIYTIISLTAIGILAAVVIYFVSKKFAVQEDTRIADVLDLSVEEAAEVAGETPPPSGWGDAGDGAGAGSGGSAGWRVSTVKWPI